MREKAFQKAINPVGGFLRLRAEEFLSHRKPALILIFCFALACASRAIQDTGTATPTQQEQSRPSALSPEQISQLSAKADSGDPLAQTNLGKAYRGGNGVPKNDEIAARWFRKAADQGFAMAESDLGTMYRMGEGVPRDKEEAFRWYQKAARHGSPEGMFNLGTCYYNGDGVGSNEYAAYAWFLLAEDAGDPVAKDAAKRSAATMSKKDTPAAFLQIAEMYDKGVELPKDEAQALRWLRKAAETDSGGKVRLAVHLLTGPEASRHYVEALDLCKEAAKDFSPALPCVGYIYRKGLGVPKNSEEAAKWYEKGVAASNSVAMIVMAEMYSTGEGTKLDRPAAFILLFRASRMGINGSRQKAKDLLQQLNPAENKEVAKKLRGMQFDPKLALQSILSESGS